MTRIRNGMGMLICCASLCVLAACTAASTKGPDTSVTPPTVGTPPPPASIEAVLSKEPFTPYAELGQSTDDGLAPNESNSALGAACMAAAGYQNDASDVPISIFVSAGLAFSQPFGPWGYVGTAEAEQYGFFPGPAGRGIPLPGQDLGSASLSAAAQTAANKCGSIVQEFSNAQQNGSLAGIQTLTNDIENDTRQDAAVKKATGAWSACMTRNGYDYPDPMTAFRKELFAISGGSGGIHITPGSIQDLQKNKAQVAMAVADADCTQSTDLAGIYFAVQTSYEQQLVNLNQQQLSSAVQQYRAAYQKEVAELSSLLPTAPTQPPGPVGVKVAGPSSKP